MSAVMYKLQLIKLTPGVSLHETPKEYVFMAFVADIWIIRMQQKLKFGLKLGSITSADPQPTCLPITWIAQPYKKISQARQL